MQLRSGKILKTVEKSTEERNKKLFVQEVAHLQTEYKDTLPFHIRLRIVFQIVMKATKFYQTRPISNLMLHNKMLQTTKAKCEEILCALDIHTDEEIQLSGYSKKYIRGQIKKTQKMLTDKYNL